MSKYWIAEIRRGYLSRMVIGIFSTPEAALEAVRLHEKENPGILGPDDFYDVNWGLK